MIFDIIVLIRGSHIYTNIYSHACSELEARPNSELHNHRGFKPRSSWLESFVWWNDGIRVLELRRIVISSDDKLSCFETTIFLYVQGCRISCWDAERRISRMFCPKHSHSESQAPEVYILHIVRSNGIEELKMDRSQFSSSRKYRFQYVSACFHSRL